MELESEEGWKIPIKNESRLEVGRVINFSTDDRTVSRRHILLQLQNKPKEDTENVVGFQVIGKNPIWFCSGCGGQKGVFRIYEKGELRVGDRLSISLKKPVLFTLKKRTYGEEEAEQAGEEAVLRALEGRKKRTPERKLEVEKVVSLEEEAFRIASGDEDDGVDDLEIRSLDISCVDPVKEFGFLPLGQEFEQYPKQRICKIKDWDWFLEERNKNSEDNEMPVEEIRGRIRGRRKVKKHNVDNDEDWTGESEDEKVLITKLTCAKRPKYSKTRSKDMLNHGKDALGGNSMPTKTMSVGKYADDENDESLGGFIVDEVEEEEQEDGTNDEEEEFNNDDTDDSEWQ